MNVSLSWAADVLCIGVVESRVLANSYSFSINFTTNTDNTKNQNVAFERMKFMLTRVFSQSTFISETSPLLPKIIDLAPQNIVLLPEEAYDQIVNIAVFCKINSVMEGMLIANSICITSNANDDISYSFDEDDALGPFTVHPRKKDKPWWARPDLCTVNNPGNEYPIPPWEDIGLGFDMPVRKSRKGKLAVDVPVATSYTKPSKSGKSFKPEIILGGKNTDAD